MQKSGVKTLSIIDTLSELAHDETEASRLALPSPISVQRGSGNRLSSNKLDPFITNELVLFIDKNALTL